MIAWEHERVTFRHPASPRHGDRTNVAGESGVGGLAGLPAAPGDAAVYRRIVARNAAEVRAP